MTDKKFFQTTTKGEMAEWKAILSGKDKDKQIDVVKSVVANMTMGKDMSGVFTEVLNLIASKNLELKKLVYLYLIHYSQKHPDQAILAVNTFLKDAVNTNPLIRALAIRTMGCIRVDRVIEQLYEPLMQALNDDDPYVRKTAAVCVAKLFDMDAQMCADNGFLDSLNEMLEDDNPMVVANAVAALVEIQTKTRMPVFSVNTSSLSKLLSALVECTEWGQVFILDALSSYTPRDQREAENICERVLPRLQHKNSAVCLSAIRVLMAYLDFVESRDFVRNTCKRMAQPLVTLLHERPPEIQYVALRNINLIVQKRPLILQSLEYVKMFFCKYYDPIYVKMEKLEILVRLANDRNIDQVLSEFKEYAQEVDVDFVRRSVRAIGRCAIKLERAAERCIDVLLSLIETRVNYVVQEAIVVIKNIFRRYPGTYETIIASLCESLDDLDEPQAKASMIWIIGEYAERIDNADELLDSFFDTFTEDAPVVQLALLTATVKLFLKRPTDTQDMVQAILSMATLEIDNPDLRDRGFLYWRLLSSDPEAAKVVVNSEKPLITDDTSDINPTLLDELVENIATLASVYHKPPASFVKGDVQYLDGEEEFYDENDDGQEPVPVEETYTATVDTAAAASAPPAAAAVAAPAAAPVTTGSLLDMSVPATNGTSAPPKTSLLDSLGMGGPTPAAPVASAADAPGVALLPIIDGTAGQGVAVAGCFKHADGGIVMDIAFNNTTDATRTATEILFNKNSFGIAPGEGINVTLPAKSVARHTIKCALNGPIALMSPLMKLDVAVRTEAGLHVGSTLIPISVFFTKDGGLERASFLAGWKELQAASVSKDFSNIPDMTADDVQARLEAQNMFVIARRTENNVENMYFSLKTTNNIIVLVEIKHAAAAKAVRASLRTRQAPVVEPIFAAIETVLRA